MSLDRANVLAALRAEDVVQDWAPIKKRWAKCKNPSHRRVPVVTRHGKVGTYCNTCCVERRKKRYHSLKANGPNLRKIYSSLRSALGISRIVRRISCSITFEQFCLIRSNLCWYCNGSLPRTGSGLDRKNPSLGYDFDNVVPACTRCNHARGAFITFEEFTMIMWTRRWRMGPDSDLWSEHPKRGDLVSGRAAR